jgi:hypothetical protein
MQLLNTPVLIIIPDAAQIVKRHSLIDGNLQTVLRHPSKARRGAMDNDSMLSHRQRFRADTLAASS